MDAEDERTVTMAGETLFREVTLAPRWLRVTGSAIVVLGVALIVIVFVFTPGDGLSGPTGVAAAAGIVVVLIAGVVALRCRIKLQVDGAQVSIRFAPFRGIRIDRGDLQAISIGTVDAARSGGIGYRIVGHRARALLFSSGPAVSITRRSDGRTFQVRSERPDEALVAMKS